MGAKSDLCSEEKSTMIKTAICTSICFYSIKPRPHEAVESRTTDFKKAWFRSQQSIRVHTHFYVSQGACSQSLARHHQEWCVSRHSSYRSRLKQALLGVIAGYVAKKSKKKQKSLVNYSKKLSGQKTEVFCRRSVYANIFIPTFLTNSLIHWKKHHIAESCASNISTLYVFFIMIKGKSSEN